MASLRILARNRKGNKVSFFGGGTSGREWGARQAGAAEEAVEESLVGGGDG